MIFAERVPGHGGQARGEVWGALPRQHHHPGPGIQVSQRAGVQAILLRYAAIQVYCTLHIEEETDRREGKGRRCCLGDGIH